VRSPVAGTPTGALNRGVFVRQLSIGDVVDVYRMRRVVEVAALLGIGPQDMPSSRVSSRQV
jgi:DNA-binding GntR family transcriptional regulator